MGGHTKVNSSLDRFIANFDTPEKCQANSQLVQELTNRINSGAPIPPVSGNDVRQVWALPANERGQAAAAGTGV